MFPSRSAASECGRESATRSGNSRKLPLSTSRRPIAFAFASVNHSAPSGAAIASSGNASWFGMTYCSSLTLEARLAAGEVASIVALVTGTGGAVATSVW
jgi:hypothetical protein